MQAASREEPGPLVPVACKGRKGRKRAGISGLWHGEGKVGSFPIPAVLESATMNQFFSIPHSAPCWHRAALTLPGAPILHKGGDAGLVPRAWAQLGTSQARCRQSRADNQPQHPRQGLIKDSEWFFSTQIRLAGKRFPGRFPPWSPRTGMRCQGSVRCSHPCAATTGISSQPFTFQSKSFNGWQLGAARAGQAVNLSPSCRAEAPGPRSQWQGQDGSDGLPTNPSALGFALQYKIPF